MKRTRSILTVAVLVLLAAAPAFVPSGSVGALAGAPTEHDVTGIWAVRQGQPFSESVYGLDIAGFSTRVHWKDVEPQRGQYNWSLFDGILARARQNGKLVRLNVMFGVGVPGWVGAQWFTGSSDSPCDSAGATIPVPWDANLRREQLAFIRVLAERYRDDPAVAFFHISGPSARWEELCLPNNTTQLAGYSNQVILDVWKEIIDTWNSVRGGKRLSFAASAAPNFYPSLGTDVANYGISKLGREFSPQWNFLDMRYASAVRTVSNQWTPKTAIGWQFWGSTVWASRQTMDYEGSLRLAADLGTTYIEVYDDDLRVAQLGAIAEQITAEMRAAVAPSTTTTTAPSTTTTAPPTTTTTTMSADTLTPDSAVTGVSGSRRRITLSGSATDNRAVTSVKIAIRNPSNGLWWRADGSWGSFSSQAATLASPGAKSTTWSFSWVPPATGTFNVQAISSDAAGNSDPSPAWRTFRVNRSSASLV